MSSTDNCPFLTANCNNIELRIRAIPGTNKVGPRGVYNNELKWGVSASAEGGKANKELLRALSKLLGTTLSNLELVRGASTKSKKIRITGMSITEVTQIFSSI